MTSGHGGAPRSVVAFFRERVVAWQQGTVEGQWYVSIALAVVAALIFTSSFLTTITLPVSVFVIIYQRRVSHEY